MLFSIAVSYASACPDSWLSSCESGVVSLGSVAAAEAGDATAAMMIVGVEDEAQSLHRASLDMRTTN